MANLFNSIRVRPPKHNRFNLSHDVKLTAKFGKSTPILIQDVLPGDVFKLRSEVLCRFAPMLAPIMTKVNVYTHFFFVPKRLVWDSWKDFITGGEDGVSSPSYPRIRLMSSSVVSDSPTRRLFYSGTLADYLGFPVLGEGKGIYPGRVYDLDALPFRAYQLIWNEYYRDQNLMDPIDIMKDSDGPVVLGTSGEQSEHIIDLMTLRDRCWKKDYFTSALPWAQRGDEVELPLMFGSDVEFTGEPGVNSVGLQGPGLSYLKGAVPDDYQTHSLEAKRTSPNTWRMLRQGDEANPVYLSNQNTSTTSPDNSVYVNLTIDKLNQLVKGLNLSNASSATINELRRAIKAQEFLEVAARGGSRYIEQIYSYFGVRSSDARLQRPEFLGGGKSPVVVSDVLQTSQSTETSAQATPSGHAISVQNSHSFKYRAEEHGYIIGIMSIMPNAAYMQGLPRMYQKFDRLDHYWPQFAHLGEQEIKTSELFSDASLKENTDDKTFGYTPRYAEYKFAQDSIHGDFRNSLSFWHMARIFENAPALNPEFLTNVQDAANRVFNVVNDDVDKIWINIHHNLKALRKMPKYGTPLF